MTKLQGKIDIMDTITKQQEATALMEQAQAHQDSQLQVEKLEDLLQQWSDPVVLPNTKKLKPTVRVKPMITGDENWVRELIPIYLLY